MSSNVLLLDILITFFHLKREGGGGIWEGRVNRENTVNYGWNQGLTQ